MDDCFLVVAEVQCHLGLLGGASSGEEVVPRVWVVGRGHQPLAVEDGDPSVRVTLDCLGVAVEAGAAGDEEAPGDAGDCWAGGAEPLEVCEVCCPAVRVPLALSRSQVAICRRDDSVHSEVTGGPSVAARPRPVGLDEFDVLPEAGGVPECVVA